MEIHSGNLAEFVAGDGLRLLKFGAVWCGPCKAMKPVIASIAAERSDLVVGDVDVDAEQEIAIRFQIQSVPQYRLFKGGREIGKATGSVSKAKFDAWLDKCVAEAG